MISQCLIFDADKAKISIEAQEAVGVDWTKIKVQFPDGSTSEMTFFDGTQPALAEAMASYLEKAHGYKVDRSRAGSDRSGIDDSSKIDHDPPGGSAVHEGADETAEGG